MEHLNVHLIGSRDSTECPCESGLVERLENLQFWLTKSFRNK